MLLGVKEPLQADAADATAIAMTHLMLANLSNLNTDSASGRGNRPGLLEALEAQAAKDNAKRRKTSTKRPVIQPKQWRRS